MRRLLRVVAREGADYVLMHNRGRGEIAGPNIHYDRIVDDVISDLHASIARAIKFGVDREKIIVDPGLGFAKTTAQSIELLARTEKIVALGHRTMIGVSRKSMVGKMASADECSPLPIDERLAGSLAAAIFAAASGAQILRVHDVEQTVQALRTYDVLLSFD
ncbi:MAG: dihydropteroate synthase [Polyangiales bacterium]